MQTIENGQKNLIFPSVEKDEIANFEFFKEPPQYQLTALR